MAIKLKVQENKVSFRVDDSNSATFKSEQGIPIYPNSYQGDYTVAPSTDTQTLQTNGLMMTDDVEVEAVPSAGQLDAYAYANVEDEECWQIYDNGRVVVNYRDERHGYLNAERSGWVETQGEFGAIPNSVLNIEFRAEQQLPTQEALTITPTESSQTAVASGKYTTGAITVNAIPSNYVGSGITRRSSTDLIIGGREVTAPSGFYATSVTGAIPYGTEGSPTATKGTVSNHSVSVTPRVINTEGYIEGGTLSGTAVTVSASELVSGTKSITDNGTGIDVTEYASVDVAVPIPTPSLQSKSVSYTPSETAQSQTVTADNGYDGLDEVNVSVGAISSTYVGSGITRRSSSDLTESKGTVTVPSGYYGSQATKQVPLVPYAIRPDAELIQSYTFDQYAVADLGLTIPAYTTTAQNLKTSTNLSPTVSVDLTNYRYIIAERFLTIPEYSVTTKGKGRQEYTWCSYIYEITRANANEFATIIDPTKKITTVQNLISTNTLFRLLYWSSSSAIALYSSNGYGAYQTPTTPSVSGTTLTVKSPVLAVRGSTTYFTNTYMNALTDIRYQYVIDVYRAPMNNLNVDGWEQDQTLQHIIDCVNTSGHDLT